MIDTKAFVNNEIGQLTYKTRNLGRWLSCQLIDGELRWVVTLLTCKKLRQVRRFHGGEEYCQ